MTLLAGFQLVGCLHQKVGKFPHHIDVHRIVRASVRIGLGLCFVFEIFQPETADLDTRHQSNFPVADQNKRMLIDHCCRQMSSKVGSGR